MRDLAAPGVEDDWRRAGAIDSSWQRGTHDGFLFDLKREGSRCEGERRAEEEGRRRAEARGTGKEKKESTEGGR